MKRERRWENNAMAFTRNAKAYMITVVVTLFIVVGVSYIAEGSPVQKLEREHKNIGHRFGPFLGYVQRIADGDTYEILLMTFPDEYRLVDLRLRDVDTPEIKQAMCEDERQAGQAAKQFVQGVFADTENVVLVNAVERDGGFGRYAGSIIVGNGEDLAALLLEYEHARPFESGQWQDGFFCEQIEDGEQ